MTRTRIKTGKNFELDLVLQPHGDGLVSFEFHQHFPEAQRPHWRRLCQFNFTKEDLERLTAALEACPPPPATAR